MSRSSHIWSHNMKSSNEVGPKGRGERVRHLTRNRLMVTGLVGLMLIAISTAEIVRADNSVARIWDDQLLHAISLDTARPTVHARNLFDMSAAMYDAWSAYDTTSSQYIYHQKLSVPNVDAARNEAISYAAFGLINERFVSGPAGIGPGKLTTQNDLRQQMISLGYDPDNTTTVGNSPAAIGNRVAQAVINYGLNDGSREAQNYASPPGQYIPVNDPMTVELSGTVMNDPNRWQPLHFNGNRIDQFGNAVLPATQKSLTPFWGDVKPFAMTAADKSANGVYHDQGPQPHLGGVGDAQLKTAIVNVLQLSSQLDPYSRRDDRHFTRQPREQPAWFVRPKRLRAESRHRPTLRAGGRQSGRLRSGRGRVLGRRPPLGRARQDIGTKSATMPPTAWTNWEFQRKSAALGPLSAILNTTSNGTSPKTAPSTMPRSPLGTTRAYTMARGPFRSSATWAS